MRWQQCWVRQGIEISQKRLKEYWEQVMRRFQLGNKNKIYLLRSFFLGRLHDFAIHILCVVSQCIDYVNKVNSPREHEWVEESQNLQKMRIKIDSLFSIHDMVLSKLLWYFHYSCTRVSNQRKSDNLKFSLRKQNKKAGSTESMHIRMDTDKKCTWWIYSGPFIGCHAIQAERELGRIGRRRTNKY